MFLVSLIASCKIPIPNPKPTPPQEPWTCPLPMPDCKDVGQTCSTESSPCWHNPTTNPEHCEEAPKCLEPEPEPTPPPPPPDTSKCPYEIPDAEVVINAKNHNQGQDSTPKICAGNDWCLAHSGKNQRCCPPAPEGSDYIKACNSIILKQACPSWQFKTSTLDWGACVFPACDHFDHDDPATPDTYEGTNPECLADGVPVKTGYWQVPHFKGQVRACTKDYAVCSNPVNVDH